MLAFSMCPGGIIAPAAADHNEIVLAERLIAVKETNPYITGIVVQVQLANPIIKTKASKRIAGFAFSSGSRKAAFFYWQRNSGFGLMRFCTNKFSLLVTYATTGHYGSSLKETIIATVYTLAKLQKRSIEFGKRWGFITNGSGAGRHQIALLHRSRMPRDNDTLRHPG